MADCITENVDGVMLIRFNRPEKMNSMGGTLLQEFNAAIEEGRRDDRVRAFVVTGEGRAWCAGADLSSMGGGDENSNSKRFNALDAMGEAGRTILNLYHADKPTIAAVNGVAVGGGFGLCSAFDIRIASEEARFGTIFIKRALGPDFGLSWFLPRLVGMERANELFYTGRQVDASEAKELGIVSRIVPADKLLDETMDFAKQLAAQPPTALTYTRRALQHAQVNHLEQHLAFEWGNQKQALRSAEFKEGVAAFMEKREPDYSQF